MSQLNSFLLDELLTNRIIMVARNVYKHEVTERQLKYVKKCVHLACDSLRDHLGVEYEKEFSMRENKIIESLSGSFISAAIRLAIVIDALEDLKNDKKDL